MITISLSLAFCTVIFRRFLDSYTGRIPIILPSSNCNVTSTMVIISGALYYLYSQLKKGTLVRVGNRSPVGKFSGSQNCIERRRARSLGWFFRNANSCRSKCADALYKVAKQSMESILGNRPEYSNSTNLDSNMSMNLISPNTCDILYNNDVFNAESTALDLPKNNKSIQNILSSDLMKKFKKPPKRISFKLDDDDLRKSSRGKGRPTTRKKLVCGDSCRNLLRYDTKVRIRSARKKKPIVLTLGDLVSDVIKADSFW